MCQEPLNQLAERLPHAHCSQSRLICWLSGLPLNEDNLPMMLPNGYVYGEKVSNYLNTLKQCSNPCWIVNLIYCFYSKNEVLIAVLIESLQALKNMAASNNGIITCPRTKEMFALKDADKVYVM